jgi:hypothetical protein
MSGKGDRLNCNPALDKELLLPDYSVTIDWYDRTKGEHYLIVCETKPPGASQLELDADYIKPPNMMKLSLDRQIKQGYSESMVIGILVQGWKVLVFYMCLEHEAIYEIKPMGHFDLIVDRMQLCKLINICPILLEAKVRYVQRSVVVWGGKRRQRGLDTYCSVHPMLRT